MSKKDAIEAPVEKTDEWVFEQGCEALEKAIGPEGLLQFLRIVSKGRGRYDAIRAPVKRLNLAAIKKDMAARGLLKAAKQKP